MRQQAIPTGLDIKKTLAVFIFSAVALWLLVGLAASSFGGASAEVPERAPAPRAITGATR